ncbi:MAG: hypothetical protein ACLP9K_08850 [Nitrososphaerales archaeon]
MQTQDGAEGGRETDALGFHESSASDSNAWDNPDWWGRQHKRLAKAAEEHMIKSLKRGDVRSSDAWSQVFSRHSKEAVKLMEFKRRVLLDVRVSQPSLQEE